MAGPAASATRDYLAAYASTAPARDPLSPYLVEYAVAAGFDPGAWPASRPVLGQVAVAGNETALMVRLRPLYALATAGQLSADDRPVQDVLLEHDGQQFGAPESYNDDIWSLRVLERAGVSNAHPAVAATVDFLLDRQITDAGWGWSAGVESEVDTTAMAIEALLGAGVGTATLAPAADWIAAARNADGGTPLLPGGASNCDSTVWSLRAEVALGRTPDRDGQEFLASLRRADGGFSYLPGRDANPLCTVEVATALAQGRAPELESLIATAPPPAPPSGSSGLSPTASQGSTGLPSTASPTTTTLTRGAPGPEFAAFALAAAILAGLRRRR